MTGTVVLDAPGPAEALQIRELPIPEPLDEITVAHADMEAGNATGKLVVLA